MKPGLAPSTSATPLRSLTAVVIDTETTSLDVKKGRIIEVGAAALVNGVCDDGSIFSELVNPGEKVPAESTAIHGITTGEVMKADDFATVIRRYQAFAGEHVTLGYSLGYDLGMLKQEHERAGLVWKAPRSLDVRDLVRLLNPTLPDFSLESIAAWLDLPLGARHRALADARLTAEIYLKLLPRLRERSIRTLAEAEDACRKLADMQREQASIGWQDVVRPQSVNAMQMGVLARVDSYPYRHRAEDVMSKPPIFADPAMTVRDALTMIAERRISSVFLERAKPDAPHGIVTERDILRAIAKEGEKAFWKPISAIATFPLSTVTETDFLYVAFGRMQRKRYRHMGVVNVAGDLVGALTQRDLMRLRGDEAVALSDALDEAVGVNELAAVWRKLADAARALVEEGVGARDVAGIISSELCSLTAHAARMAEQEVAATQPRPEALRYAVMVLGSGGRGESLLALDQDNAIIFDAPDEEAAEAWLEKVALRMNAILDEVGVPFCKGGVMAGNRAWRKTSADWRRQVASWLAKANPKDLLHADIFFDAVPVHGDRLLADDLMQSALSVASHTASFTQLMGVQAAQAEGLIGWFGRLATDEDGRMDLKKNGILPIFATARVLALRHGLAQRSTLFRLEALRGRSDVPERQLNAVIEAHEVLLGAILRQQLADIAKGVPPSNRVDPAPLPRLDRDRLKWALEQLPSVSDLLGVPAV